MTSPRRALSVAVVQGGPSSEAEVSRASARSVAAALEQAGLQVGVSQLQAWRGAPLEDGTRLTPLNPVLVLRGQRP